MQREDESSGTQPGHDDCHAAEPRYGSRVDLPHTSNHVYEVMAQGKVSNRRREDEREEECDSEGNRIVEQTCGYHRDVYPLMVGHSPPGVGGTLPSVAEWSQVHLSSVTVTPLAPIGDAMKKLGQINGIGFKMR